MPIVSKTVLDDRPLKMRTVTIIEDDARCGTCRFWASMVAVGKRRACGAMFHAQSVQAVAEAPDGRQVIGPYFAETQARKEGLTELYTTENFFCGLWERAPSAIEPPVR